MCTCLRPSRRCSFHKAVVYRLYRWLNVGRPEAHTYIRHAGVAGGLVRASCTIQYALVSNWDENGLSTPWCLKFTRIPVCAAYRLKSARRAGSNPSWSRSAGPKSNQSPCTRRRSSSTIARACSSRISSVSADDSPFSLISNRRPVSNGLISS
jgi:hypothetical protein